MKKMWFPNYTRLNKLLLHFNENRNNEFEDSHNLLNFIVIIYC